MAAPLAHGQASTRISGERLLATEVYSAIGAIVAGRSHTLQRELARGA